ncbi:MAG: hypothetical protein JXL97_16270 [Bacteroidales bacterium]|nr:hypothetical protein [Bacteroidales bacterium]
MENSILVQLIDTNCKYIYDKNYPIKTNLLITKNKIRITEIDILSYIRSKTSSTDFRFSKLKVVVKPVEKSNSYTDEFDVEIFLSFISFYDIIVLLDKKESIENDTGVVIYAVTPERFGLDSLSGFVLQKTYSRKYIGKRFPFEFVYNVEK